MTLHDQYLNGARTARTAWSDASTVWTHSVQDAAAQARAPFGLLKPTVVITEWAGLARQLQHANREYTLNLLRAVSVAADAGRQYLESVGSVIRDQVHALSGAVQEQAGKAEQIAQEQLARIEQAERDQAREARAAGRREARQAERSARERYHDKTKTELVEELSSRDLPKTGTVDELIDRLIDADAKQPAAV